MGISGITASADPQISWSTVDFC